MTFKNSHHFQQFYEKNTLGIDFGTKSVGLATFCPGRDPYPLPFKQINGQKSEMELAKDLLRVIEEESIDLVVLGIPRLLDGKETKMGDKIRQFGEVLKSVIPSEKAIEIHYQDETLSSYEAMDRMKKSPRYGFKVDKDHLDALAASIILEDFFAH